jgi:Cytochrome c554 and c-prime
MTSEAIPPVRAPSGAMCEPILVRALGLVLLLTATVSYAAGPAYVGAETCGTCHPAEFAAQSKTGHARALRKSAATEPGDWAFGSGAQATTFVSRVDRDTYREHGATWYRATNGLGFTPGHRNAAGILFRLFDPDARILRCFGCHSTGPLSLTADQEIVPHELGVRCEQCHGPGSAHAADPAANRLRTTQSLADCASCHRLELGTPEENRDIHDPRNARNQPLMLAASACFRASKGKLTCFTCHAPHSELQSTLSAYDRACQSCHPTPRHRQPIMGACAGCHMPSVRYGAELRFVDHRISVPHP